ncbi:SIS domain-containing protein [Niallia circulans]
MGKPSYVARYSASLLSSTGTPAYFLDGTEAIHGSSGQVVEGDVVIAISNSGETEELKKTIHTLRENGAIIISITGNLQSSIARQSDFAIFAGVSKEGMVLISLLELLLLLNCLYCKPYQYYFKMR